MLAEGLLGLALLAARRAAVEILSVYRGGFSVDLKADSSPITEADRRAHAAIAEVLEPPGLCPLLSEEGGEVPYEARRLWRRFWLIDPLDGTKEFVKRNGEFTVNVALIEEGQPALGVVYAPVPDLLYAAHRELGAFKVEGFARLTEAARLPQAAGEGLQGLLAAGRRLPRRQPLDLSPGRRYPLLRVTCSRSHRGPELEAYLRRLRRDHAERVELQVMGSALKPCAVAEGRADLYARFGRTMEWDTAAAHAVLQAVGLRLVAADGGAELTYNKPDLANPPLLAY